MASALLASRAEPLWGERKVYARKNPNPNPNSKSNNHNPNPNSNSIKQLNHGRHVDELESISPAASEEAFNRMSSNHRKESTHGGFVTFNIAAFTKRELKDLKKRLLLELEEVHKLRNRIESEFQSGSGYEASQLSGVREIPRPASLNHLSDLPSGDGFNGKQMPKGKKHKKPFGNKRPLPFDSSRDLKRPALGGPEANLVSAMMEQCGQILTKLMVHKHGWVFNVPVDVVGMGLHDYHQIIKYPMDLGTVKSKLGQNLYSTPLDFAADVRLTFNNALTYNPKGHDVFVMAKMLLTQFEKWFGGAYKKFQNEQHRIAAMAAQETKWGAPDRDRHRTVEIPVEANWERESLSFEERRPIHYSARTPTSEAARRPVSLPSPVPESKQLPPSMPRQIQPPAVVKQSMEKPAIVKLPKPKARDINKREMTFDEKLKLRMGLQDLPPEKMDQVVQLMRRRNAALSQNDDEIELDMEVLDKETLWELDRFVGNYRKMMCKIKRHQELELNQNPSALEESKSPVSEMTEAVASEKIKKAEPVCVEEDIDIGEDIPTNNFPPVEIEKDVGGGYASRSSSSSSSSSGSSSSSDSDSGSSSDSDSDEDDARSPLMESKASPTD